MLDEEEDSVSALNPEHLLRCFQVSAVGLIKEGLGGGLGFNSS